MGEKFNYNGNFDNGNDETVNIWNVAPPIAKPEPAPAPTPAPAPMPQAEASTPSTQRTGSMSRMGYDVDLVFCIDATESMDPILDTVKEKALNLYQDFKNTMEAKNKKVGQLRVRIIAFRDYYYDKENAMMATDFFSLPEQAVDFESCIRSIVPLGGGDDPEDGLEAIAYAMKSDWSKGTAKKRQVIVVWSDAGTHDLGFGKSVANYPAGMAKDFNELTEWWGGKQLRGYMDEQAKRLLIFAPDRKGWSTIRDNWNKVIHVVTSDDIKGLADVDYDEILSAICNSI